MAKDAQLLTSSEFAEKAGIPVSKVTKLIRDGIIKAEKKSGKWMLEPSQLKAAQETPKTPQKPSAKKTATTSKKKTAASTDKSCSIPQFAEMTYLTEQGVLNWLKEGRLTGRQDGNGEWQVDAANLEVPDIKRLVR